MEIRIVAERLAHVSSFFLWDISENEMEVTDEIKAFTKRYRYLMDKYKLTDADDPDIYEGDFSEWDDEMNISFDKELNLLEAKFDVLLGIAGRPWFMPDDNPSD